MKGRNDNFPDGPYARTPDGPYARTPDGPYARNDVEDALHDYADRQLADNPSLEEAVRRHLKQDAEADRKVREIREINAVIRTAFPAPAARNPRFSRAFGPRRPRIMRLPLAAGIAAALIALMVGFVLGRQSQEIQTADGAGSDPAPVIRLSREAETPAGAASPVATPVSEAMLPSGKASPGEPTFPSIPVDLANPQGRQGS